MRTIKVCGEQISPSKIVCVGRNYVAHVKELGNEIPDEMVVFFKPNSALSSTLHARHEEQLHYEGEIAFVIKDSALCAVGFGLDLTKRELQSRLKGKGLPWERAKAFDGAALFSDFVALPENLEELMLELKIDADIRQAGGVELMMYKPSVILEELGKFTTLNDGDIIMTGTPAGVGEVIAGNIFEGRIILNNETLVSASWTAE